MDSRVFSDEVYQIQRPLQAPSLPGSCTYFTGTLHVTLSVYHDEQTRTQNHIIDVRMPDTGVSGIPEHSASLHRRQILHRFTVEGLTETTYVVGIGDQILVLFDPYWEPILSNPRWSLTARRVVAALEPEREALQNLKHLDEDR